ncbi:MAG: hypothetical protein ACOX8S_12505 [Christensenellales bacterium]|jgi:hypothetical protein
MKNLSLKERAKKVNDLLNQLADIGGTFYVDNNISKWHKIGMAISSTGQYVRGGLEIAMAMAEDWNSHYKAAVIHFLLGRKPFEYMMDYFKEIFNGEYILADTGRKVRINFVVEEIE